jgi:hypothetical protein
MKKRWSSYIALFLLAYSTSMLASDSLPLQSSGPNWGFFAHRRINRLAVFTLPPEMMAFFKRHIDWISDHAVDPDMRRYATTWEAPRHYIDLDLYGAPPFDGLPRSWARAVYQFSRIGGVTASGDTTILFDGATETPDSAWMGFVVRHVVPRFTEDKKILPADTLNLFLNNSGIDSTAAYQSAFFQEVLSQHGILPWHLQRMQRDLTNAFRRRDARRILRLCAEIGHYIGDAHVPLHTTSNYNGAKTKQDGIHAFWESRIPELFADSDYNFWVGKPEYIERPAAYFWSIVLASNAAVDTVLATELRLRQTFDADKQICPDIRLDKPVLVPCREFTAAWQVMLNGMVERRMRATIHALSSAWYTAWVDAGQPDLKQLDMPPLSTDEKEEAEQTARFFGQGRILGRPEGN